MPYYLHHHFDPDFDHTRLKPREDSSGHVDHYDLGYVQNVIKDQVLAELYEVDSPEVPALDPRFVLDRPEFPKGARCRVNPDNPMQLMAEANGYVHYDQGRITVREMLNVRRDVDFHTGNIVFVGNMVIHGRVRSGFSVQARNVLVKDNIQDATVIAQENLKAEAGVMGGRSAMIQAGKSIHAPFVSNCRVLAGESLVVEGSVMHSQCYVRKQAAIKGRLQGGDFYANGMVLVQEQVGGGGTTITNVVLGLDPFLLNTAEALDAKIRTTGERIAESRKSIALYQGLEQENELKLEKDVAVLNRLLARRAKLDRQLSGSSRPEHCGLLVPGEVKPGLEISIGSAYLAVDDILHDVRFTCHNNEIVVSSPALRRS